MTLTLLIVGCDSRSSPEEVIADSQIAADQVQSYRWVFESTFPDKDKAGNRVSETTHGRGEWVSPNRIFVRSEGLLEGTPWWSETIAVGRDVAVRASGDDPEAWRPASGADLAGGVGVGLAFHKSIISVELEDLRILGDTVVNGISSVHLRGLRSTKNSLPTPSMGESLELPSGITFALDLFISKNDYHLVRFRSESVLDPTGHFVVVDFYDYNESIFIEFPEL